MSAPSRPTLATLASKAWNVRALPIALSLRRTDPNDTERQPTAPARLWMMRRKYGAFLSSSSSRAMMQFVSKVTFMLLAGRHRGRQRALTPERVLAGSI